MADHWEPIRVYEVEVTAPNCDTTKQQIVTWLESTNPDRIESAGQGYVEAAKLIRDEGGVQDAIMDAASGLARVWRGESATKALKALRLLYASAGALADAMHDTGQPMTDYAREVRTTREKVASAPANNGSLLYNDTGRLYTNGGNYGAYGGSGLGTGQTGYTPPLITGNGDLSNTPLLPPALQADAQARRDLEALNIKIDSLNRQLAEGLAFQMPDIAPLEVELEKQSKLDPGSGTRTPTGTTTYWNGGGSDGGGPGSGVTGGGDTGNGSDSRGDTPQDPGRTDPEQGRDDPSTDDPSTDPRDPSTPEQPGRGEDPQPTGQNPGQDGADRQQDVPAVIGADNRDQTQLADAGNPTTTTPPGTTTNPYQTTPNATVIPTTTQPPATTPNPYAAGQPGAGTWYGTSGTAPAATPAVLRGGAATPGSGFMAYPPGAGMGAVGSEGDERTREIYDPEPGIWSVSHETSPEKIG
ncbi:WXG100 family type VII secretion target [Nonomuraea sp. 10N515B]|uniref:WXG100 family type VII secretion target n=1 Tax=Nonomuraea sp. 10N515B TaxID=3457422 RepID=UPI003FCC8F7F